MSYRDIKTSRDKKLKLLNEFLKSSCCICGYKNCKQALEFHHKDNHTKTGTISNLVSNGKAWLTICEEVEKCILLCANCHREVHFNGLDIRNINTIIVTDTIKNLDKHKCITCGTMIFKHTKFCNKVCKLGRPKKNHFGKVDWSSINLLEMHKTMTNIEIGKLLGVSDSYISRRIRQLKKSDR